MKTAIYVEDGFTQIVLTPVTAFEREILSRISREEVVHVRVANGSFHRDAEGWQRFIGAGADGEMSEQCLMLRLGTTVDSLSPVVGPGPSQDNFIGEVPLQVDENFRQSFRTRDL